MLPGSARSGFTLLELCVAIFLALLLMAAALPSLTGQAGQQRLQHAYDRFDALVAEAQKHSVTEGRPYTLAWNDAGAIRLYPADASLRDRRSPVAALIPIRDRERYTLERNASLSTTAPAPTWTFWPSGNCEPVTVRFEGTVGTWTALYNPLSTRGTLTHFAPP